jgi:hypothetical protein
MWLLKKRMSPEDGSVDRLGEIEKRLNELLDEVKRMRKEKPGKPKEKTGAQSDLKLDIETVETVIIPAPPAPPKPAVPLAPRP